MSPLSSFYDYASKNKSKIHFKVNSKIEKNMLIMEDVYSSGCIFNVFLNKWPDERHVIDPCVIDLLAGRHQKDNVISQRRRGEKACGNVSCTAVAGRRAAKPNMQTCQSELRPWSGELSLLVPLVTWSKHNWFEEGEPDCFEKHSTTHPEWNINSAFHAVLLLPHSAEAGIRTGAEMEQRIKNHTFLNGSYLDEYLAELWDF